MEIVGQTSGGIKGHPHIIGSALAGASCNFPPSHERLLAGKRTIITCANSDYGAEVAALQKRNAEFHKPWIYHTAKIDEYFRKIEIGKTLGLLLWATAEQRLIGVINLNEPVFGALKSASLGFYIDARFAGQGYMTEGLSLALDYAFADHMFHRLEANVQPTNIASVSLVKGMGFRLEGFSPKYVYINGVWCDHQRWAILSDEWHQLHKKGKNGK